MTDKSMITKPIAAAVGVAFVSSMAISSTAVAADNPFAMTDLDSGYMLAGNHEGEEGKCGEKGEEGSCGEKGKEGSCGEKGAEGSCGEKGKEGACGEKGKEGKCGEGKCGGDKD
jgi:uncharacterized low-complexity protein